MQQRPGKLKALLLALVISFIFLVSALAYPAILFKGPLLEVLPAGLGLGLLSTAVLGIGVALWGSYPGALAHPHSAPTIMLGVVVAEFVKSLPATVSPQAMLPTVLGLIAVASLLSGLCLFLLGRFRLANMIRYVPLPVIAGVLAGSAWLLLSTSVTAATGKPLAVLADQGWRDWDVGLKVAVALSAAFGLWLLNQFRASSSNLFYVLFTLLLGFWGTAFVMGFSQEQLIAGGWLFPPMGTDALWTPTGHALALQQADWLAIARMLPLLLIVVVINAFGFLVYNSGIEQATEQDIDLNQDATRIGLMNVAAGVLGGMPGFQNSSLSIMVHKLGAPLRIFGVVAGLTCLLVLTVGGSLLTYMPKVLAGTMLAFLGMSLLQEWLLTKTRLMSAMDRGVVVLVFLSVIFLGFLQALAVGAVAGIVLFVVRYSGIPVARNILTGNDCQSTRQRSEQARACLRAHGEEILILRLHGFIFFGSASRLVSLAGRRVQETGRLPLRHLILDFRLVSGLDVSALASFAKLERYALRYGFKLLICHVPAPIAPLLRSGFPARKEGSPLMFFDLFDAASEWAEDRVLEAAGQAEDDQSLPFEQQAASIFGPHEMARALRYFDVMELSAGFVVSRQGDASTDIFFVEEGRVAVLLSTGEGSSVRLSLMGPGALIGEIAFYLDARRSASIVTESPTMLRRLTRLELQRMQEEAPDLALALHQYMAHALAFKLVESHRMVRALSE